MSPGLIPPKYSSIIHERFKKRVAGKEIEPLEVQVYKKNGDIAWINGQMSRLRMNGNDLIQILIQDITMH